MSEAQLAMTQLLDEADERARAIRDKHRGRVFEWWETLNEQQKAELALYMVDAEWDTCASLSVAACDFYHGQLTQRPVCTANGGDLAASAS